MSAVEETIPQGKLQVMVATEIKRSPAGWQGIFLSQYLLTIPEIRGVGTSHMMRNTSRLGAEREA